MATTIKDIPGIENQISNLKDQAGNYQSNLNTSPTALGGSGTPTSSDIANQESLNRINSEIQTLNDQRLRTKWYGTDAVSTAQEEPNSPGFIGKTLDYLARPLYGVVGAVKHFTGQGTGSLQDDLSDNIARNKNTFGDVLKTSGLPWAVAAPLGFALDVGLDPVNWATMGTGALVPRLAMGAVKGVETGEGVLRGIGIAGKSGLLESATTAGRFIPFLRGSKALGKLGEASLKATDAWEALSGINASKLVLNRGTNLFGLTGSYRIGLGEVINKVAKATPGGEKFVQNFIYDPVEWVRQARVKDIIQQSLGTGVDVREAVNAAVKGESIEPFLQKATQEFATKIKEAPVTPGKIPFGIDTDPLLSPITNTEVDKKMAELAGTGLDIKLNKAAPEMVNGVDDAVSIIKDQTPFVSADPMENALRIANEKIGGSPITLEELSKIVNSGIMDQTGVKWFDKMMQGIKDYTVKIDRNGGKVVEVGKTVLDNYDRGMSIFKIAKVAASPSAWMNAVVGNMLMTHMATGSISPRFMKRLAESQALYRNKTGKAALFDSLMMDAGGKEDVVRRYLAENPTAARGTLGDISYIGNPITGKKGLAEYTTERVLMNGHDAGIVSSAVTAEQIKPEMVDALAEIAAERDVKMARAQAEHNMKAAETVLPDKSGVAMTKEAIAAAKKSGQNLSRFDIGTGMMSQELFNDRVQREMFDWMANKAKENPGNMAYKLLDFTFNKMPEGYEKIDQAYKMATFMTATRDGYTLNELRGIRHLVDVNPEELTKTIQEGQYLYKLHPRTAIELANVMYLNYAAMPAAVRVLRNIPILRSPFISFMYGMTLKTGQTLAYNPSAFNKVTFALNDFGGLKTPLEKKALDTKFYSYLKQPGMVRLPDFLNFFDKNPVYANLSSMIPYYSLNMFNPSQAQYDAGARGKIMEIAQKSSLMSDPLGSVLLNYLIQPLILGSATQPQGQFGQPLYPVDATGLEKVGYAARTFGESMVPNIYSYAGLVTPESLAEYVPSYRWKQLARAKEGLNPLGISSKESKLSRTTRGVLQTSGIPIQAPVNTSFSQQQ